MSSNPDRAALLEQLRLICRNVCRPEIHQAMKSDPRWPLLSLVAVEHIEADEYGPAESYEHRNCGCNSTLTKPIA